MTVATPTWPYKSIVTRISDGQYFLVFQQIGKEHLPIYLVNSLNCNVLIEYCKALYDLEQIQKPMKYLRQIYIR